MYLRLGTDSNIVLLNGTPLSTVKNLAKTYPNSLHLISVATKMA